MKKNLLFAFATFFLMTTFGFGQAKFKEYVWEEVGLKFSIPNFVKINSKDAFGIEMESEDFLIYVELKDDFDDLQELVDYYEVKEVVSVDQNINEPTYTGEAAAGFIEAVALGDDMDIFNVFGNLESKLNDNEKIAFDISIYEWNDKTEGYLNQIMGSIQFYDISKQGGSVAGKSGSLFSAGKGNSSATSAPVAVASVEVAAPPKKRSFFSKLMDVAGPVLTNAVPFGGVATGILKSFAD
jgi:hypothetical protein